MRFLFRFIGLAFLLSSVGSFADELPITGTSQHQIPVTHANKDNPDGFKEITVLEYEIPDQEREQIYHQVQRRLEQQDVSTPDSASLPKKVQLGMANVPVLDQGQHGTCATFAATSALDATLGRGDYVSQLCLLQLGNYLEAQGDGKSGWKGESFVTVLERIEQYGIISKEKQHRYTCGGYLFYPYFLTPSNGMSLEDYAQHHESLLKQSAKWKFLLSNRNMKPDPNVLQKIKTALHAGSRVVIGTLLPRTDLGTMGATGKYHYAGDTWVLTYEIAQDLLHSKKQSGHSMVITGYDDQAKAKDEAGQIHQGLFTLRNSWGSWTGDWGDFYMSYDYAQTLIHAGVEISKK